MHEQIFENPRNFFVTVLHCTKTRCSKIEPWLKIKRNERGAP